MNKWMPEVGRMIHHGLLYDACLDSVCRLTDPTVAEPCICACDDAQNKSRSNRHSYLHVAARGNLP